MTECLKYLEYYDIEYIVYFMTVLMLMISSSIMLISPILYGITNVVVKILKWEDSLKEATIKCWISYIGLANSVCPSVMYAILCIFVHTNKGGLIVQELSSYELTNNLSRTLLNGWSIAGIIFMSLIFTLIFSPLALKWDTEIEEYDMETEETAEGEEVR